ncbi:unnamed protein product [Ixodes pacificus]
MFIHQSARQKSSDNTNCNMGRGRRRCELCPLPTLFCINQSVPTSMTIPGTWAMCSVR